MGQTWWQRQRSAVLVVAAVAPLLWCALAAQLGDDITVATAALVLVLLVVAAAATGDRWAGLVAAVSGGAWFDFFLTAPVHRFTIEGSDDVEVAVLLVVVGVAVTELALWGLRQQSAAGTRAGYLDGVLTTSRLVAGEFSAAELAEQVSARIVDVLDVDACRFVVGGPTATDDTVLGPDGHVTVRGVRVTVERDGLPVLTEVVLPAQHHGVTVGRFLVTASSEIARPSLEQRQVAVLLAGQVGAAYATGSAGPRDEERPTRRSS